MVFLSELGQRLKKARDEKGISLEELQKVTKIQKRYLQAIEEGRFEVLPGKFYARAFVKNYAEAVNLDPEQLFEEHHSELPNPQKGGSELPSRAQRTNAAVRSTNTKLAPFLPAIIAVVFILVVGIGAWLMLQSSGGEEAEGVSPDEQEQTIDAEIGEEIPVEEPQEPIEEIPTGDEVPIEEPVEEEPIEEPQHELTFVESSGNTSSYELTGTDEFSVVINFTGRSYVGIKNTKGKSFYASEVTAEDELTYDFSEEEGIEFNFGASNFVEMTINGEEFSFPLDIVHQKVSVSFNLSN
ncbi:helix-turn-helix domain-containing protein [Bacillus sp. FJAT-45350]|uniref:helix-turn-helix domain-containing protein n=1 Tax=Bacillus sp. FJAT-45350 TaxID=2011014 RepID=UPI00211BEEED|nr:RodZ domain-containing protein [Bacillus sp. FJAT-45350]